MPTSAVRDWLRNLDLERYAAAFEANDIDVALLTTLTDTDLRELGVASLGHRKRILAAAGETPAAEVPGTERRQVTILFADIVGFTTLSSSLDPEEIHRIVTAFGRMTDGVVEELGGTVDKHIGDAVMALFGAPVAHGDDPLRAVKAALRIHAGVAELGRELGRALEVHAGIASGEVVAGTMASQYTVLGDAVNLASRLEGMAGPRETVISDAVHARVARHVTTASLGEVVVKGLSEPVHVWRVEGLAATFPEQLPLIGRRPELSRLESILDDVAANPAPRLVVLRGEPGLGKSRLLAELTARARARGYRCHQGAIIDFGGRRGADAIGAIVACVLGIGAEGQPVSTDAALVAARGRIDVELHPFVPDLVGCAPSAAYEELLDAMSHERRRSGRHRALASIVSSEPAPRLIAVEDVHWASAATWGDLAALASVGGLLVLTTRPTPASDPLLDGAETIDLEPLAAEESRALCHALAPIDGPLLEAVVTRAAGNPLFLEQLGRSTIDELSSVMPASVQSVVQARVDQLPHRDRVLLQAGAVLGQCFELAALRQLVPNAAPASVALAGLVLVDGPDAYRFAHALVREGVYASLLRSSRQDLHIRAAAWYEGRDASLAAGHLERAGDPSAPGAYRRAAHAQRQRLDYDEALRLVAQGESLATDPDDIMALALLRGEVLFDMGAIGDAQANYRRIVDANHAEEVRCHAWIGLARCLRVTDSPEAHLALDRALEPATRLGLTGARARIHVLRANLYFPHSRLDDCERELELARTLAEPVDDAELHATIHSGLGDLEYARGRIRLAVRHYDDCIDLCRRRGLGRYVAVNQAMRAFCRFALLEIDAALQDVDDCLSAAARTGDVRAQLVGLTGRAILTAEIARPRESLSASRAAIELAARVGARRFEVEGYALEGLALHALDDPEGAARAADVAWRGAQDHLLYIGPVVLALRALLAHDRTTLRTIVEEGRALLRRGALSFNHYFFSGLAIEACLAHADLDAVEQVTADLEEYDRGGATPIVDVIARRARALVQCQRAGVTDASRTELELLVAELDRIGLHGRGAPLRAALRATPT